MGNAEVICGSIDRHAPKTETRDATSPKRVNTLSDLNPTGTYDEHRPSVSLEEMHRRLSLVPDAAPSETPDSEQQQGLRQQIRSHLEKPENAVCADCDASLTSSDSWVSVSIGAIVCLKCSGVHRSMGTHISKIRSVELDTWDETAVASVLSTDNKQVNDIYEFHVPEDYAKPRSDSSYEIRSKFIHAKYRDSLFVQKADISRQPAVFATA